MLREASKQEPDAGPADLKSETLRARDIDLVPFTLDDVDEVYQGWLLDDGVVENLEVRQMDRSMPALRAYVTSCIENPNRYFYMIVARENGRRIGTASMELHPLHMTARWGYMIGEREYWGTGVSLQAQVVMFDVAFERLGVRRFFGGTFPNNIQSHFNLKRLGFKKEGVFRKHLRAGKNGDEFRDLVFYALLAEEWFEIRDKFDRYRDIGDGAARPA